MNGKRDVVPRAFDDEERDQIRARLLAAGALAQRSGAGRSVADLARAAGISKGAFYLFFPSRDALWAELAERGEATGRVALRAASHGADPVATLFTTAVRHAIEGGATGDEVLWNALCDVLVERGEVHPGRREALLALPSVAAGLATQRSALGPRWSGVVDAVARTFAVALAAPR
jgi:AcrR family transcriptional regulator